MTQVNLLPSEIRERQRTRRIAALIALGGAALVAALLFIWVLQGVKLNQAQDDLDAQQATNKQLQTQVQDLQRFADIRADEEQREKILSDTLAGTVPWSGVLHDLSLVIPDKMWLTSMTGSLTAATTEGTTAPTTTTTTTTAPALVGSIQFQGDALDKETVALWLTRLEQVHGWVNPWLSQAQESKVNTTPVVTFSSSVDLSDQATRKGIR